MVAHGDENQEGVGGLKLFDVSVSPTYPKFNHATDDCYL